MKKLLNNRDEFQQFQRNINPCYLFISADEEEPESFPCIIVYDEIFDGFNDCIYYEFVYVYDF